MGHSVSFWEMDDLLGKSHLKYELSTGGASCRIEHFATGEQSNMLDLLGFQSVWLRRPGKVKVQPLPEQWMESLAEWECSRALDSIFRAMPALWVNPPAKEREALLKLQQLDIARRCGLKVPDTLVTNDPEAAEKFYSKHKGQVVYKLIDEASFRFFPTYEVVTGMPTLPVREADLEHFSQVELSLHLFQNRVDKVADIRVTAVSDKLFPVEILSQEGRGKLDFRLDYSVPMNVHKLPDEVSERCLSVLRALGLTFGAFDLCLDRSGEYVFLEVNPSGQWMWMERKLGLPISLHLARLLAGVEKPLEVLRHP
jgi:glutathione synthase/RimK-type ligase-like ATP-grasp enzyme